MEWSGEIVANCGFDATRETDALSRTDTLPKRWHASERRFLAEIKGTDGWTVTSFAKKEAR